MSGERHTKPVSSVERLPFEYMNRSTVEERVNMNKYHDKNGNSAVSSLGSLQACDLARLELFL